MSTEKLTNNNEIFIQQPYENKDNANDSLLNSRRQTDSFRATKFVKQLYRERSPLDTPSFQSTHGIMKGVLSSKRSSHGSGELVTFNPPDIGRKKLRTNISPYVMPTNPTPTQLSELSMPSQTRFADYSSVLNYKKPKGKHPLTQMPFMSH